MDPTPAPAAPVGEQDAAAGDDQVEQIEQVLAVHKIGRTRRGELARQADDAGLTAGQVGDILDSTTGGGGLKIRKVEDLIDAAHATRERAQARVEAEAADVLTGSDRAAALERGRRIIADRLK